jgi:hypothetical protein
MGDAASFLAAFPSIQTAIKVHGNSEGMRIQLDIPESEMGEAAKLLLWRQRVLRVTIEPEREADTGDSGGLRF